VDGNPGDVCVDDADCISGLCANRDSGAGVCTSGQLDDRCEDDADCLQGVCINDGGFGGLSYCRDV